MDVITLAIIGLVAIADPDQRPFRRGAGEHAPDTDPEHVPGPN